MDGLRDKILKTLQEANKSLTVDEIYDAFKEVDKELVYDTIHELEDDGFIEFDNSADRESYTVAKTGL